MEKKKTYENPRIEIIEVCDVIKTSGDPKINYPWNIDEDGDLGEF